MRYLKYSLLFILTLNFNVFGQDPPPADMPIIENKDYTYYGNTPNPQRDEVYRKWLSASVKIMVSNASGSGSIVYYDGKEWAYIQSCGHLWSGNMSAEQAKRSGLKCRIAVWYHNEKKLPDRKEYGAEVLYYSNVRGQDCSLLRFKPDWNVIYIPIAPEDYPVINSNGQPYYPKQIYHSVGCDSGTEVARYAVRIMRQDGPDYITNDNSPRPGRSGGGLFSEDYYIGICWGTSSRDGTGIGYFTPLKTLRFLNQREGYGWLNDIGIGALAQRIPIIDRSQNQRKYPNNYIPLPQNN